MSLLSLCERGLSTLLGPRTVGVDNNVVGRI